MKERVKEKGRRCHNEDMTEDDDDDDNDIRPW